MEKLEVVTAVIDAFDRAEKAEAELSRYKNSTTCEAPKDGLSRIGRIVLEIGKKAIFKDSTYGWNHVSVSRDGETDALKVTSFDMFVSDVIRDIPEEMSKKDFVEYFDDMFRERYEEDKKEAIESFKEEEGE